MLLRLPSTGIEYHALHTLIMHAFITRSNHIFLDEIFLTSETFDDA